MGKTAAYWIRTLELIAHPEGGYFKETYASSDIINKHGLPERYFADRTCVKAIYFLLQGEQTSKFHRLKCNEIWGYHLGASLTLYIIDRDGTLQQIKLGPDFDNGEQFQIVVPHGVWFGAKVNKKNSYVLVSCITAPGFDFEDFELAERQSLLHKYPQHKNIIEMLA
jgi:predicted cupin superfamily sugar epimerase